PLMIYGLTLIALFYAGLLMLSLVAPGHLPARLMRIRPLRMAGKVSYCVYLLHEALIVTMVATLPGLVHAETGLTRWIAGVIVVAIVLTTAQISWVVLESRMLKVGHRVGYGPTVSRKKQPALQTLFEAQPGEDGAGAEATESAT